MISRAAARIDAEFASGTISTRDSQEGRSIFAPDGSQRQRDDRKRPSAGVEQPESVRPLLIGVVVLATIGGAALRLATVSYLSLWGDELATLKWVQRPVDELLRTFGAGATSHLYLLLMKPWIALCGVSPLAVKLPSLLAGVALVPLVWLLGRRWLDPPTAAVATLMAASSKPLIFYSRMARPYAILTVVGLVSAVLLLDALRTGSRRSWVLLAIVDALMVCATLNAFGIVVVQLVFVAVQAWREPGLLRRRWLDLGAAMALSAVLSLAFYSRALDAIVEAWGTSGARHYRPRLLLDTFQYLHPSATLAMFAAMVIGAWIAWRRGQPAGRLLVLWAIVPPLVYLLLKPSYNATAIGRYLLPGLPAQLLLMALALTVLARRVAGGLGASGALLTALALALAGSLWQWSLWNPAAYDSLFKEQRPTAAALRRVVEVARPGDLVTFDLETRFAWLFAFERRVRSSGIRRLVSEPGLQRPGRLLILTNDRPLARDWWSRAFHAEVLGGPRFREQLFLLTSETVPAGPHALVGPLRAFLQGYVETAEGDSGWSSWKASRQQLVLSWAHDLLGRLSADPAEREMHRQRAQSYDRLWRETQREARPGDDP